MATAKLVRARRNADTARRIKNNWKKQFFEMRDQRDAARNALIELRNWVRKQYPISPQPTMPQPETNCPKPEFFEDSFGLVSGTFPSSKLSGHDQVTRDEFDQEAM